MNDLRRDLGSELPFASSASFQLWERKERIAARLGWRLGGRAVFEAASSPERYERRAVVVLFTQPLVQAFCPPSSIFLSVDSALYYYILLCNLQF